MKCLGKRRVFRRALRKRASRRVARRARERVSRGHEIPREETERGDEEATVA